MNVLVGFVLLETNVNMTVNGCYDMHVHYWLPLQQLRLWVIVKVLKATFKNISVYLGGQYFVVGGNRSARRKHVLTPNRCEFIGILCWYFCKDVSPYSRGSSSFWLNGNWIYNCNQCLSRLTLWLFQLYLGDQFYRWRKAKYLEKSLTCHKWLTNFIT
jgi:hypothetical protein